MRRATKLATAALLILVLALVGAGPAEAKKKRKLPRGLDDDLFGVFSFQEPTAPEFQTMLETGIGTYRMFLYWRDIEPEPPSPYIGQRSYDWRETDSQIRSAAAAGVRPHLSLYGTPSWVSRDLADSPMKSHAGRTGWRDFALAAVKRYGNGGAFWAENPGLPKMLPVAWQLWNEQNTSARYKPGADPEEYAELLRLAGEQILRINPRAKVMPGGMFGTPQTPDSMEAWTFVEKLLAIPGTARFVDAIGLHPYSPDLRGVRFQIRAMRQALKNAGHPEIGLELTEIGWSSGTSDRFFFFQGRKGQAKLLAKTYKMVLKRLDKWKIERLVWLAWKDIADNPDECGFCNKFGLLREDLKPKPSYNKFRKLALKTQKPERKRRNR